MIRHKASSSFLSTRSHCRNRTLELSFASFAGVCRPKSLRLRSTATSSSSSAAARSLNNTAAGGIIRIKAPPRRPGICSSFSSSSSTLTDDDTYKKTSNQKVATIRLYRILQRQCKDLQQQLLSKSPQPSSSTSPSLLLLQPPMNQAGFAGGGSEIIDDNNNGTTTATGGIDKAASHSKLLRLFYLWSYAQKASEKVQYDGEYDNENGVDVYSEDANIEEIMHLRGWLTNLVIAEEKMNHDSDGYGSSVVSNFEGDLISDYNAINEASQMMAWTNIPALQGAIRHAFRNCPVTVFAGAATYEGSKEQQRTGHQQQQYYREWSIRAFQFLRDQELLLELSSVSTTCEDNTSKNGDHHQHHVRVVATSCCVGKSLFQDNSYKYRFAYRIRIENIASTDGSGAAVQLLGRTWVIQETGGETIRVHAPQGGAVGKFPVLEPGQSFLYYSGCDLATPTGTMKGCFHMKRVEASSGDAESKESSSEVLASSNLFEVVVRPFALRANDNDLNP